MTDDEPLIFPPEAGISASQRLWSEEVGQAQAHEEVVDTHDPAYEFSNGRKFRAPDPA